jgi:hypothetical protein
LADYLVATRICGDVATPRQNNLRNARRCAEREPMYTFGLDFARPWTYEQVVALLAERVGISPDLGHTHGQDRIDPYLCIDALEAMAARIGRAARERSRVLFATGHPSGLLAIHLELTATLRSQGCTLLQPGPGAAFVDPEGHRQHLRHVGGVAMISGGGDLAHTHLPEPMRLMLEALEHNGEPPPDLVVADHGYAGVAGAAGVPSIGFADCNDPALFVGEAEGSIEVVVPLDDNVAPHLYAPVSAYLVQRVLDAEQVPDPI